MPANVSVGRLHVITDERLQSRYSHVEIARRALDGGADVIQYREKRPVPDGERFRVAGAIQRMCSDAGAVLVVDDRADIAQAVGAGVHLGPTDIPISALEGWFTGLVGGTANDLSRATSDAVAGAHYLGVGPAYATSSKGTSLPDPLGVSGLAKIIAAVDRPVIAIGGIELEKLESIIEAGVYGVAVLGAVCLADDPTAATAALSRKLRSLV